MRRSYADTLLNWPGKFDGEELQKFFDERADAAESQRSCWVVGSGCRRECPVCANGERKVERGGVQRFMSASNRRLGISSCVRRAGNYVEPIYREYAGR